MFCVEQQLVEQVVCDVCYDCGDQYCDCQQFWEMEVCVDCVEICVVVVQVECDYVGEDDCGD